MASPATSETARTIFVVEDDEQIATMLADILEDEGYRVHTGVNGSALRTALAQPPGMIFLDVMMPGMDGIEFCRLLRQNPATSKTPVVFITAAPIDILAPRLRTVSYEGLVRKPFTIQEILRTAERHMAQ